MFCVFNSNGLILCCFRSRTDAEEWVEQSPIQKLRIEIRNVDIEGTDYF